MSFVPSRPSHWLRCLVVIICLALSGWIAWRFQVRTHAASPSVGQTDCGTLSFQPMPLAPLTTPLQEIQTGDFNNDGKLDVVGALFNQTQAMIVLLNAGNAQFTEKRTAFTGLLSLSRIVARDFNGDGKLDVAGVSGTRVQVLAGDGTGGFAELARYDLNQGVGQAASDLAAGDFNGDGKPDLAAAVTDQVAIFYGAANGLSGAEFYDVHLPTGLLAAGDFNGDGKTDVAAFHLTARTLTVLLGKANRQLDVLPAINASQATPDSRVLADDFNDDGKLDLVVGINGMELCAFFFGDGRGAFSAPRSMRLPSFTYRGWQDIRQFATGDFNRDGKRDLAMMRYENVLAVSIFLGDGKGEFSGATMLSEPPTPVALAAGDFNGDGKTDLAIPALTGLGVQLNQSNCLAANTPPTFAASVAGFRSGNDFEMRLGTIRDIETEPGRLAAVISSTSPGLQISQVNLEVVDNLSPVLQVAVRGVVTCEALSAELATVTLRISDAAGAVITPAVSFNVILEPPPASLFAPLADQIMALNSDADLPVSYPNNLISQVSVNVSQGFRGLASMSGKTLLIRNAAPVGTYDVTITVRESCGTVYSTRRFKLTVAPPVDCSASRFSEERVPPVLLSDFIMDFYRDGRLNGAIPLTLSSPLLGFADLNGDHAVDVISASTGFLLLYLNDGAGRLLPAQFISVAAPYYRSELTLTDLAVGDFNRDGKPDIALAGIGLNYHVAILLNQATVSGQRENIFSSVRYVTGVTAPDVRATPFQTALAVADFNRDGLLDLALAGYGVTLLNGLGDATFKAPQVLTVAPTAERIVAGDLNGDGQKDLVVVNNRSNSLSVLLNDGVGGFTTSSDYFSGGLLARAVTISDLNGDNKLDLAVTNEESQTVGILLGDGRGAFSPVQAYLTGNAGTSLVAFDVNRDGKNDLLVVGTVLYNEGDGRFATQPVYSAGNRPDTITTGDFNGDGLADFAVAGRQTNNFAFLYLAQAAGGFGARIPVAVGTQPSHVLAVDFNGDRRDELVVANAGNGTVSFVKLLPNGTALTTGQLLTGLGANYLAAGDLNGDNRPELLTINSTERTATLCLNDGLGNLGNPQPLNTGLGEPTSGAIADFNGDGKNDLLLGSKNSALALMPGDGAGGFGEARSLPLTYFPGFTTPHVTMLARDLNADNKMDVAVGDGAGLVHLLMGKGAGEFETPQRLSIGWYGLAAADFNGDGRLDVAGAGGSLSIAYGQANGKFRAQIFAGTTVGSSVAVMEVNRDGKPDVIGASATAGAVIALNRSACSAAQPQPVFAAMTAASAADYRRDVVTSGQIVSLFGRRLANATRVAESGLSLSLGGTTVLVRGSDEREAYAGIFFTSDTQLNILMPAMRDGLATIFVMNEDGTKAKTEVTYQRSAPGLFTANASGQGLAAAQALYIRKADGRQHYEPVARFDPSLSQFVPVPIAMNDPTEDAFLVLYGTGLGGYYTAQVNVGGLNLPTSYVGRQGTQPGLDQINIPLNNNLAVPLSGRGIVSLSLPFEGRTTNVVQVAFR